MLARSTIIITAHITFLAATLHAQTTSWEAAPPMTSARTHAAACAAPGGTIYVAGGIDQCCPNLATASAETFDGAVWVPLPAMNIPRSGAAAAWSAGFVYVIGGSDGTQVVGTVERLDTTLLGAAWSIDSVPQLPVARALAACTVDRLGRVWVIGGNGPDGETLASVEVYDPARPQLGWQAGPTLNEARTMAGAVMDSEGRLLAIGGARPQEHVSTVERLDPLAGTPTWEFVAPIAGPAPQSCRSAVGADGSVYRPGGWLPGYSSQCLRYRPDADAWSFDAPLNLARNNAGVVLGRDGYVYAIGGDVGFGPTDSVERLNTRSCPADINGDRTKSAQDLFDFLAFFFGACP